MTRLRVRSLAIHEGRRSATGRMKLPIKSDERGETAISLGRVKMPVAHAFVRGFNCSGKRPCCLGRITAARRPRRSRTPTACKSSGCEMVIGPETNSGTLYDLQTRVVTARVFLRKEERLALAFPFASI